MWKQEAQPRSQTAQVERKVVDLSQQFYQDDLPRHATHLIQTQLNFSKTNTFDAISLLREDCQKEQSRYTLLIILIQVHCKASYADRTKDILYGASLLHYSGPLSIEKNSFWATVVLLQYSQYQSMTASPFL